MAARTTEGAPNAGDDLDALFGYELDDEIVKAVEAQGQQQRQGQQQSQRPTGNATGSGADLGLNEEVKITKKRQPVAKLDEERLLSQSGLPKLRAIANDKLTFKGKGHEFDDVSRLLEMYQLWMDDMYPRAKMMDSLAIIEKLGHSKRMQMLRKHWIDEGKPKEHVDDIVVSSADPESADAQQRNDHGPDPFGGLESAPPRGEDEGRILGNGALFDDDSDDENGLFIPDTSNQGADVPMDDLDALLAGEESTTGNTTKDKSPSGGDEPMDDDLDALLAEGNFQGTPAAATQPSKDMNPAHSSYADDFADDMEAMGDAW